MSSDCHPHSLGVSVHPQTPECGQGGITVLLYGETEARKVKYWPGLAWDGKVELQAQV